MTTSRTATAALFLALAVPLVACGVEAKGDGDEDAQTLTVLSASSLTDVFEELAERFESEHPGTDVELTTGSSTILAEQVADGAPGDILATADEASLAIAEDAGVVGDVETFATNALTLVTPAGNPAGLESIDDLDGTTWVRCADEAPCGKVAAALLETNGVTAEPASLEEDARATLDKVVSGEADAGLVYATDAVAAGDAVTAIGIPGAEAELASYYVATLEQAEDEELAQAWVTFVVSDTAREVLVRAGFGTP